MSNAAKEIKTNNGVSNTTIFETSVSNDGTWQRRGLALMNGNISMIFLETGRIIDTEPISRYCQNVPSIISLRQQTHYNMKHFYHDMRTHVWPTIKDQLRLWKLLA